MRKSSLPRITMPSCSLSTWWWRNEPVAPPAMRQKHICRCSPVTTRRRKPGRSVSWNARRRGSSSSCSARARRASLRPAASACGARRRTGAPRPRRRPRPGPRHDGLGDGLVLAAGAGDQRRHLGPVGPGEQQRREGLGLEQRVRAPCRTARSAAGCRRPRRWRSGRPVEAPEVVQRAGRSGSRPPSR